MNTLLLGAAGFLGINLVDELQAAGVEPRCGRRRRTNVLPLRTRKATLVPADLDRPAELEAAMQGVETVFHLAGHYPRLSLDRQVAMDTGTRQLRHVLDAAARSGVARLIFVSSTATVAPAPGRPSDERDVFREPPGFGLYHDLKWLMEETVLAEDRFQVVVACPGACLGPWDLRMGTSALLVGLARGADPPHPDGIVNTVDVRDVAEALHQLARHEAPPRRILLSHRSQSLHALLCELAPRYGVAPPSPPLSAAQATELSDREEARASKEGGRADPAREIVDLIVHGVPISSVLAETQLNMRWTPLERTLDSFDAWARRMRVLPPTSSQEIQ